MQVIRNDAVAVMAQDNGRGVRLHDLKRGMTWLLDEPSAMWGGLITKEEAPIAGAETLLKVLQPQSAAAEGDCLTVTCLAGECRIRFSYTLLPDGIEVTLPPPDDPSIESVSMPGAFVPEAGGMKLLLPIMQGMLWDGRGEPMSSFCRSGSHTGFSMQMYGVLGEKGALLAAAETAVDSYWWYQKDGRGFRVQNLQDSSLGTMRYERRIRFYFTDPGITPVAKRYRARVKERGRFVTWEEKIAQRPVLENLFGSLLCFIGYCQDDLDYAEECRKLRAFGFDRARVYPVRFSTLGSVGRGFRMGNLPPIQLGEETIRKVQALGYDVCPWTWINEIAFDGTPEQEKMLRVTRDGDKQFGWQIDDNKWFKVCSPEIEYAERKAVDGPFKHMTGDHFDVLTCASIGECYAKTHEAHPGRPLSREESLHWLRRALVTGQGKDGRWRAVGSENFNDLFSLEYDIGTVKAWPQFGPWIFWPVPLTDLVYHDSIIHSWWEGHNYNDPWFAVSIGNLYEYGGGRPDLQAAADALTGSPPDVFPFGAQYAWTGRGKETFAFRYRYEDQAVQYALSKALPVTRLHRRIGKLEMTDFEILSENGWLQRTAFSDGTTVTANFGCGRFTDVKGAETVLGPGWKAE